MGLVTLDNINPAIRSMEHVVRGPLFLRAVALEKELKQGSAGKQFSEIIWASVGDSHAMGQQPITFLRQILGLVTYPPLFEDPSIPEDAKERARTLLSSCMGNSTGSYTDSVGIEIIRHHLAQYITERDGGIPSDPDNVMLTDGASAGIKSLLVLLRCNFEDKRTGVMIPIPQYPLFRASITELEMAQISYHLDEEKNWAVDVEELKRALENAKKTCVPRVLVIINPGNPTGQVLTRENIKEIIKFAHDKKLIVFADEVYQENTYGSNEFHSFKKVMTEMGPPYNSLELCSFMTCSKGYLGECGFRGGSFEVVNLDPGVKAMLMKSLTVQTCPNIFGQIITDIMAAPPKLGDPSYDLFIKEKQERLQSLQERADIVTEALNSMKGLACTPVQGAMYAFPQLRLPPKALDAAKAAGQEPDYFYALQLLEKTGICMVPGSIFGQKPGTYHLRTTILPQLELLKVMLKKLRQFHEQFMDEYK
ncbi:alanine aminotransferase 2-like [Uranotaenia lowii]|uniref:alanine aminotransferase 2-like n=1 Tax=Uranotaenia lowii TaxID=190385 RepID=UPI0024799B76|nr:alanine aminotransferase 2-like [Uranotaenia lowii]